MIIIVNQNKTVHIIATKMVPVSMGNVYAQEANNLHLLALMSLSMKLLLDQLVVSFKASLKINSLYY